MKKTVLILGGSGRFGRHATRAFQDAGWEVWQFNRATDDLWDAAWGASVIVNAWNPPDYSTWATDMAPIHAKVREVALASGATVIVPGNVYPYGEGIGLETDESAPHTAANPLGQLRTEMEAAYKASGVKTILLRAGDFIDTENGGNWFESIITAKLTKGRFVYPGPLDRMHAWAYLPDLARAAVMLAEKRDALATYEEVNFRGYALTGQELGEAVQSVLPERKVNISQMSWLPIRVLRPAWRLARYLVEMRYLWDVPHSLGDEKLKRLLPEFQPTPLRQALSEAFENRFAFDPAKSPQLKLEKRWV